ncbi:MAG: hypothetical protein ABIP68_06910 [Ferruginibacter sp.]
MKTQLKSLFILSFLTTLYYSCSNGKELTQQNKEGLVSFHSKNYSVDNSNNVDDYNFNVWYSDSYIIIQFVYISFDFLPDSNSKSPSLETLKYVYVNLKNLHCQDYRTFDDSEHPLTNYKLKKGEIIQRDFFSEDEYISPIYNSPNVKLFDTVIKNIRFKRFLFKGENVEPSWQRIIYLTKKLPQNIIHLDWKLDRKYFPFKIMRFNDYTNGNISNSSYYDEIKIKLSDSEKAVFKQWKLNADTTFLPVLTLDEVREGDIKEMNRRSNNNYLQTK